MLRRFFDDIFIKWRLSLGDPNNLLRMMNDLDSKINFSMETGKTLPFLDVSFSLTATNTMETDIYYKETDSHNYVQFFSFHPHKTLTNIPYSLARRICTIVSNSTIRDHRLEDLRRFMKRKQYPEQVITNGIERAKALNRCDLLQPKENSPDNSDIPFVHTFNSANPQVLDVIRNSISLLAPSEQMNNVMNGKKIIAAQRQPPNMKSLLFRPRFRDSNQLTPGSVRPCCHVKT